jgi:hypothetical protein
MDAGEAKKMLQDFALQESELTCQIRLLQSTRNLRMNALVPDEIGTTHVSFALGMPAPTTYDQRDGNPDKAQSHKVAGRMEAPGWCYRGGNRVEAKASVHSQLRRSEDQLRTEISDLSARLAQVSSP